MAAPLGIFPSQDRQPSITRSPATTRPTGRRRTFTRECLAIEVDTSLPGLRLGQVLDRIIHERGRPEAIITDNGPEFTRQVFNQWC